MAPPPLPDVTDDLIPYVDPRIAFTVVSGSVVLYDTTRGLSHVLNASAAHIWSAIDGEMTVAQLTEQLASTYGVEISVIGVDVHAALARLAFLGIVGLAAAPGEVGSFTTTTELTPESPFDHGAIDERVLRGGEWLASSGPRHVGGTTIEVRTNRPAVQERLDAFMACLPVAARAEIELTVVDLGADAGLPFRVFVDAEQTQAAPTVDVAVSLAQFELNRLAIASTPNTLRLHGGAVERDGRVVVVVGPSGRGKSTLCAALVQHGFAYLTDEVVIVEPGTWRVTPYAKAVELGPDAQELLGLDRAARDSVPGTVSPVALGQQSSGGEVGLIVVLAKPDATETECVTLDPVGALLEVLANTFAETMDHDGVLDELGAMCEATRVVRMPRLDIEEAIAVVARSLA